MSKGDPKKPQRNRWLKEPKKEVVVSPDEPKQGQDESGSRRSPALVRIDWEKVTKVGVVWFGVMYVVGMLAVQTYLYRIGVTEIAVLRLQYIYTGALAITPVAACTLAPMFAFYLLRDRTARELAASVRNESRWQRIFIAVATSRPTQWFGALVLAAIPLIAIWFGVALRDGGWAGLWAAVKIYVVSVAAGMLCLATVLVLSSDPNAATRRDRSPPKLVLAFGPVLFLVAYACLYLPLFTDYIYTVVPRQFGGGQPEMTRLVFYADKKAFASDLGVPISPNSNVSEPVKVLMETEKSYVISPVSNQVTRLSKSLIAGVRIDSQNR